MLRLYLIQYMLYILLIFNEGNAVIHHKLYTPHEFRPVLELENPDEVKSLVPRQAGDAKDPLTPCNEDDLMVYLAEMSAINPESIVNLCSSDDFVSMCNGISDSLDKVDEFLGTCKIVNDKDLYIQLLRGVDKYYEYLCNTTSNSIAFQRYFYCYRSLHEEYEACAGPADWTEYREKIRVCNSYKEIADCYFIKTAKICGLRAAKLMKKLMKTVFNVILTVKCDIRCDPFVADPMPESGVRVEIIHCLLLLTIFLIGHNFR